MIQEPRTAPAAVPAPSATAAVELTNLTKRYGATTAVDRLNLVIPRGTTFGLIGPNGAGKSTTLKMLMGMLRIDGGSARALGIDVSEDPAAVRRLGADNRVPAIR